MSDYEIVRGMGAPPAHGNLKYPFDQLDVGDGVYIPTNGTQRNKDTVGAAAINWARRNGRKFTTRRLKDGRVLVVRVE